MKISAEEISKVLDSIRIPPCPALLQEVLNEARRPDADTERITAPVRRDAAMTAALLQLANSRRDGDPITSVSQAISLLGPETTLNLLNNITLGRWAGDGQKFTKFWERSSLSATVSARLARKISNIPPDEAYTATLFHDCGIPVLMQHYPDYRQTVMANSVQGKGIHEVENAHFSTTHAIVGNMLARNWSLPPHICQAILHHHDVTIFTSTSERISHAVRRLIGLIHIAELIVDEHFCQKNPEWELAGAEVLAYFGLSDQEFWEIKDDALFFLSGE